MAVQPGLCRTWSETPKTGFLRTRLKYNCQLIGVGNMTDNAELEMMASKPVTDFAFEVNGYGALPKIKNILAYRTCECK